MFGDFWISQAARDAEKQTRQGKQIIPRLALNDAITATELALEAYRAAGLPSAVIGAALYLLKREKEDRR